MHNKFSPIMLSTSGSAADIIYVEFPTNLQVDLKAAREIVEQRLQFAGPEKHYLILDMSNVRGISSEAKNFLQQPEGGLKNILGAALIASNPVSALIANIFVKTPKSFEARFFHKKQDAIEWVHRERKKRQND
jgi:hypothetical protein